MSLPITTRGSQVGDYLPNKEALLRCFAIATTPEAADYLVSQFEKILKKTKTFDASAKIFSRVVAFAANVHLQRDRRDPWSGIEEIKTDFQTLQQNLAEVAAKTVSSKVDGNIRMDVAVSDLSELLRVFSVEGKPVDPEINAAMDKLFNAYLADNNIISKGSILYEATNDGEVKKDMDGNPVKANVEKIKKIITAGFEKYLEKKEVAATIQSRDYPEKKPPVATKPAEVPVPEQAVPSVTSSSEGPDEGTTPSTTASGGI